MGCIMVDAVTAPVHANSRVQLTHRHSINPSSVKRPNAESCRLTQSPVVNELRVLELEKSGGIRLKYKISSLPKTSKDSYLAVSKPSAMCLKIVLRGNTGKAEYHSFNACEASFTNSCSTSDYFESKSSLYCAQESTTLEDGHAQSRQSIPIEWNLNKKYFQVMGQPHV